MMEEFRVEFRCTVCAEMQIPILSIVNKGTLNLQGAETRTLPRLLFLIIGRVKAGQFLRANEDNSCFRTNFIEY